METKDTQLQINSKKQKNTKLLIGAIIFLSFIFGWAFGHLDYTNSRLNLIPNVSNRNSATVDFGTFWTVWDKVVSNFDGKLDYQKMIDGAINGMVNAVGDPYTLFMNAEQTKSFNQELEGSITGIGAEVGIKDDRVVVISPIANSPAEKAGIRAQDIIVSIDGNDTKGMDLGTAVSKIRGDAGTKVKLLVLRGDQTINYEITRAKVTTNSVTWKVLDNNIGYIQITRFDSNTSALIKQATTDLTTKDLKAIVLDLRNNPGGFLDAAVTVGSEFIKSGTIVTEKTTTRASKEQNYVASGKGNLTDTKVPMVVLVNGGSASASEIVAGAIQDSGRGILIGEKTFGKGSVQTVDTLPDGSSIRITIAHWFTPKGKNINKEGIAPNITVTMTDNDIKNALDSQLNKAIEYLKTKM